MKNRNEKIKAIVYGSVVTGCFSLNDEKAAKNTKAYQRLLEIQKLYSGERHNVDTEVKFDVLGGSYRNRKALKEILDSNSGIVIIDSISALGPKKDELLYNYRALHDKGIGLVVQKEGHFSTAVYDAHYNGFRPTGVNEDFERFCYELVNAEVQTNRGKKKLELSKEFTTIYWLYENYFIDTVIFKNKLISISKSGFAKLCAEYENTEEYKIIFEIQIEKNKIDEKPKRIGSIDESIFQQIYDLKNSGSTLSDACKAVSVRELSEIELNRYLLKYSSGKSATHKAAFQYKDAVLVNLLKPDNNTSLDVLNRVIRDALGVDFMLS